MKKIVLTGGGTAGHVYPALALVPHLRRAGFDVYYVGSKRGIERRLAADAGVPYHAISAGKLRRYFSFKNFTDLFRIALGFFGALRVLMKIRPDCIFSKGGFVVVPVALAAWVLRIKLVIHESDITPGLASRLCLPFAHSVCVTFPETFEYIQRRRVILTGLPLRTEILGGARSYGLSLAGFDAGGGPVALFMGGSQGAAHINAALHESLDALLTDFRCISLTGSGNLSGITRVGFKEFEYLTDNMADILAAADIVVCRAGATTLFELVALHKPALLIPLPKSGTSRGDQIKNAESFLAQGFVHVLPDDELTGDRLVREVKSLYANRLRCVQAMKNASVADGTQAVVAQIKNTIG